jgi:hypothetical protein
MEPLLCSFYNSTITSTVTTLGGGERVRTDDLLRARQALSQLSYTPNRIYDVIVMTENLIFQFNFQLSLIDRFGGPGWS